VHNTQDDKIYLQQHPVSAFQHQAIINQVSLTGLHQSEGQDLVLLQCILKVTMWLYSHKFYHMVERVKSEGREGGLVV
jgi:hypothetical protein